MEVVYDDESLKTYMNAAVDVTPERPILIDRFLSNAIEFETDAICDGENVFIPAVMEHIELAGIHSGDSACVLPSFSISQKHLDTVAQYTKNLALSLNVRGLINMQYAIADDKVYVLEANPRASRTVPLVSKVSNINMVKLATQIIAMPLLNTKSPLIGLENKKIPHCGVKEAVFPFNMLPETDPILGPEMRSTGEVLGLADNLGEAFYKAQEATGVEVPSSGTAFISVNDRDKAQVIEVARSFEKAGFKIIATGNTHKTLCENGINSKHINKLQEGRPNIFDAIVNKQVDIIINTPTPAKESIDDDSYIRKAAIKYKVNYFTTVAAARVAALAVNGKTDNVKSIQDYHKDIK